jgi:SAM-dependent methyltransferase
MRLFRRTPKSRMADQLQKMRLDWDQRARDNARHYVENSREHWSDEEFFANGRECIAGYVLTDTVNIYQGKDPQAMRVLEIGCGAGRLTLPLAELFGEVHAVDVSGEMVARARQALAAHPHAHVYQNNGCDLSVVPPLPYDFAFSMIVFQHIPSYEVIENYVREVHRLLRPGALFKFQVQGGELLAPISPDNTWEGVGFTEEQARKMAERCGFEMRYAHGAGEQYFWLWFFKPETDSAASPARS